MLNKIKTLADSAIKLQNKAYMDEVLRDISELCELCIENQKYEVVGDGVNVLSEKSLSDAIAKIPAGVKIAKGKGAKNGK